MATTNTEAVVATPREGRFNKNAARRVRVSGKIPAVVYGAGQDAVAVAVVPDRPGDRGGEEGQALEFLDRRLPARAPAGIRAPPGPRSGPGVPL